MMARAQLISPGLHRFWILTKSLAFPVGIFKWIFFTGLLALALGAALGAAVKWGPWPMLMLILMCIGWACMVLYLGFLLMVIPGTLLAMVSSKQLSQLPQLRVHLLVFLGVLVAGAAVLGAFLPSLKGEPLNAVQVGCSVFLVASVLVLGLCYGLSYWANAYFLVWLPVFVVAPVFEWLPHQSWVLLLAMAAGVWLAFSYWWLRWRSNKLFRSPFLVSQQEMLEKNTQRQLSLHGC